MSAKIYQLRVGMPKPSIFERIRKSTNELPIETKILSGAAIAAGGIALLPAEAALITGAAGLAGAAAIGAGLFAVFNGPGEQLIEVIDNPDELANFIEGSGDTFVNGAYYIAHPKNSKSLLLSSRFHKSIILEQISELISFLRSKSLVTKLRIEVTSNKEGRFETSLRDNLTNMLDIGISYLQLSGILCENSYSNPVLVPMIGKTVWLDRFQSIVNAVSGVQGGVSVFEESQNLAFGIKIDVAERIGVEATWLNKQSFKIRIEYNQLESTAVVANSV